MIFWMFGSGSLAFFLLVSVTAACVKYKDIMHPRAATVVLLTLSVICSLSFISGGISAWHG